MSSSITVTLPDGSQQSVPAGSRPMDVAKSISQRLADDAVVARIPIGLEPLTVGRDPARDVVLDDNRVSRLHLQVFVVGDCVIAEDLGSSARQSAASASD